MLKFILFLFFIFNCFSQKDINVIFYGVKTKLSHFELDLIKDLISDYSKMKNQQIAIKYKGVKELKNCFSSLLDGDKDATLVINGISITKERLKTYDFSKPYMINKFSLVSRKDFFLTNTSVKTKIAVASGSIQEKMVNQLNDLFPHQIVLLANSIECMKKLDAHEVDMVFGDFIGVWVFDLKLIQHINEKEVDQFGIMYRKGSKLKKDIDIVFEKYKKTNRYSKLLKKHFGDYQKLFFDNASL